MPKRIFTLKESLELLPQVQEITQAAVSQAEALVERLEMTTSPTEQEEIEERYGRVLRTWASRIMDLGPEVKGKWLVDFDSGDGIYYCWHHPEPTIEFFHDYDTGFAGRRPLGKLGLS
jgi:hypothetical protein